MNQQQNEILIDALNKCVAECNRCTTACLGEQDISMLTKCIQLNIDCGDVCALTAALLARGSKYAKYLLKTCMEMCNGCAEECEKHADMQHCAVCAEACRKCAEECANLQGELMQQFHAL
jgi:hypothetical protein